MITRTWETVGIEAGVLDHPTRISFMTWLTVSMAPRHSHSIMQSWKDTIYIMASDQSGIMNSFALLLP
jgi:hypothetical protein